MKKNVLNKYKELKAIQKRLEQLKESTSEKMEKAVKEDQQTELKYKMLITSGKLSEEIANLEFELNNWIETQKDSKVRAALRNYIIHGDTLEDACRYAAKDSKEGSIKLRVMNALSELK